MRRLAAIVSPHAFGHRVLRRAAQAGIRLGCLIISVQQSAPRQSPDGRITARLGRMRARLLTRWRGFRAWRHVAQRLTVVDSLADQRLTQELVRCRPDVLVLAGTGIVSPDVLAIPRLGTLNAHPGLLPWVRGVCPFEHALLRGVPLGVTVHAVDAGIDTGPIVRRVLLPVTEGERDRITLARRLEDLAVDTLVDVISQLSNGTSHLDARAQRRRYPYGRWVSDAERSRAIQLLGDGEAARLYEQWRAAAGHDVLPNDDGALPGPSRSSG